MEEVAETEGSKLTYDERLVHANVSTLNCAQQRAQAQHIMKEQQCIALFPTAGGEGGDGAGGAVADNDNVQQDHQLLAIAAADAAPQQQQQ